VCVDAAVPRLKGLDGIPLVAPIAAALFAMRLDARSAFALPKLQAVTIVLLALLIVWLVRVGRGRTRSLPPDVAVALGAVVLWSIISSLTAVDRRAAFFGADISVMGLASDACGFVLFVFAATWFTSLLSIERYLQMVVALVALVAVHAIGQYYSVWPSLYSGDAQVDGVVRVLSRPAATIGHPVALGAILGMSLPFTATFAIDAPARGSRVCWTIVAAILGAALLVTQSRGPWIGSACGSLVLLRLRARRFGRPAPARPSRVREVATAAIVMAVLIGLAAVEAARGGGLSRRVASFTALRQDASLLNRLPLYSAALRMIEERPLVGGGLDTFATVYPRYREREPATMPADAMPNAPHNGYLQLATATGVPGLTAYVCLIFIVLRRLIRTNAATRVGGEASLAAACAASICVFLIQDLSGWSQFALNLCFWLVLGVAVGVTEPAVPQPRRAAAGVLAFAGVALTGAVLITAAVRTTERLRADVALFRAQTMAAYDPESAELSLKTAIGYGDRVPWVYDAAAVLYLQRLPATRSVETYQAAATLLERAAAAYPFDPYVRIHRVDLDATAIRSGVLATSSPGARRAEQRAAALDPNNASVYESSARLRFATGDLEGAAHFASRIADLRPEHPRTLEVRGDLLWAQSRPELAAAAYRDAVARAAPDSSLWLACQRKLVMVQLESGHPREAVDGARQALGARPDDSLLHTLLGAGYEGVGAYSDAIAAYERALALDRRNTDAANALRRLHSENPQ
jgi:O-antigen ligase/tetratricopeptide (TPR) repeat protein